MSEAPYLLEKKDMQMNQPNGLNHSRSGWRKELLILVGIVALAGTAVAEEKPVAGASSENGKAVPRISPHVLAAQRRAQQLEEPSARIGMQSQMHKDAVRRHIAPTRSGA
jgi:hypothetical protein